MLLLLKSYALAPAFRLKPSVIPVATRRFFTTTPKHSSPQAQKTRDKPKRFLKKDLEPPKKRPLTGFVAFTMEKVKEAKEKTPGTSLAFTNILAERSAAWKKLSDEEKKAYNPSPKAVAEWKAAARAWREGLSDEAKRALKVRRMRKVGTGFTLYVSENYKDAKGNNLGERVSSLGKTWKLLSDEERAEYSKRSHETLYGSLARRAAQAQRESERVARAKIKLQEEVAKKAAHVKEEKLRKQAQMKKLAAKVASIKKAREQKKKEAEKKAALKKKKEEKKKAEKKIKEEKKKANEKKALALAKAKASAKLKSLVRGKASAKEIALAKAKEALAKVNRGKVQNTKVRAKPKPKAKA